MQGRIQDFPLWDANLVGQMPTTDTVCFIKLFCQNERIGTLRGGSPVAPPGSANAMLCYLCFDYPHQFGNLVP